MDGPEGYRALSVEVGWHLLRFPALIGPAVAVPVTPDDVLARGILNAEHGGRLHHVMALVADKLNELESLTIGRLVVGAPPKCDRPVSRIVHLDLELVGALLVASLTVQQWLR